jgi:hypothetical protein
MEPIVDVENNGPSAAVMAITMRRKVLGSVLIVIVGLLNFHLPHFVLERPSDPSSGAPWLELVFLAVAFGAIIAAAGILRSRQCGWLLGVLVVVAALVLCVTQETVGLPGLPQNWFEPSRIVSLIFGALFILAARNYVGSRPGVLPLANC